MESSSSAVTGFQSVRILDQHVDLSLHNSVAAMIFVTQNPKLRQINRDYQIQRCDLRAELKDINQAKYLLVSGMGQGAF